MTSRRRKAALAIAFSALLLSACVSQTSREPVLPPASVALSDAERWTQHLATVYALGTWEVRGKVAYRLPDDAGSASLQWQQTGVRSQLRLSGPLGAGNTRITTEGALLRVERDGIEHLYPSDAAPWLPGDELLPVPVASIQHWLRGVPDPASPSTSIELEGGLAQRIEQLGWEVEYTAYEDERGLALPKRLTLTAPAADLSLRVVLREWQLP